MAAALPTCSGIASCSQDDIDSGQQFRPGEHPLSFTATVEGLVTRSEGKNAWADGDVIGVKVGDYAAKGRYKLNADGTINEAIEAASWLSEAPGAVIGWYPFDPQTNVTISDQTGGIEKFDYLAAIEKNQRYNSMVRLSFRHLMAKVSCKLVAGEGVTAAEMKTARVSLAGYTSASFIEGVLTGSGDGWIATTPDYEALLVPQSNTGRPFLKVDITVNVNGVDIPKTLTYTPRSDEANLMAGTRYIYTVTVKKDRLEVQSIKSSWTDDGGWHPAGPAPFRVYMPKNHGQTLIYSDNVEPHQDYLLVHGNRFSISYEANRNNLNMAFDISRDQKNMSVDPNRDKMTRKIVDAGNDIYRCEFDYYLLNEEVWLDYVDFVQVGDYYYDDGSWGPPLFLDGKKPIGVVFKAGASGDDNVDNYNKGWETIHGYVVAIHDATKSKVKWGAGKTVVKTYNSDDKAKESPYSGYNYTLLIKTWGESGNAYDAVKNALAYMMDPNNSELKAPVNSSGWYLPSILQQLDIQFIPNRATLFTDVEGEDLLLNVYYWSCVERSSASAYAYKFDTGDPTKMTSTTKTSTAGYVRAVLTF